MIEANRALFMDSSPQPSAGLHLRVASWNLLRRIGAGVEDVADLIRGQRPDLLLLQEATEEMTALPSLVGGHFFHHPMLGRIYGLAAWTPHPVPAPRILPLPVSALPGRVPPRIAQIVHLQGISFANVHLSHGQFLNRWQLLRLSNALEGPAAIVGDFNSVGPIVLSDFRDIGPRRRTFRASNIISLRLDRCMARSVRCTSAKVLEKGPSDHRPIVLELTLAGATTKNKEGMRPFARRRRAITNLNPDDDGR
jgi:endonuclease/exonuclease/phosphatase family metal-dependent hydrolase